MIPPLTTSESSYFFICLSKGEMGLFLHSSSFTVPCHSLFPLAFQWLSVDMLDSSRHFSQCCHSCRRTHHTFRTQKLPLSSFSTSLGFRRSDPKALSLFPWSRVSCPPKPDSWILFQSLHSFISCFTDKNCVPPPLPLPPSLYIPCGVGADTLRRHVRASR